MAYDEADATRIRNLLAKHQYVEEKRIVGGGLGFLVTGHLCCGVSDRGLTVRVGPETKAALLGTPHVRPLEFGGRQAAAFIVVDPAGYRTDDELEAWVERGIRFVSRL